MSMIKVIAITLFSFASMLAVPSFAKEANAANAQVSTPAKIAINQATAEQLTRVKGLGKKKAYAVVEYREAHGNFTGVDDLVSVKGISQKLAERIAEQVVFK
jgi:competence protein ComEA